MQLPVFKTFPKKRETYDLYRQQQMLTQFGGYDRRPEAAEGTWYDQTNMGTWSFPALSTRRHRLTVTYGQNEAQLKATAGLTGKDHLITVNGTDVIVNGYTVDMTGYISTAADTCPKQLVSMGAYLLIWPDKAYLNTQNLADKGSMDAAVTVTGTVTVELAKSDGTGYGSFFTGAEPGSPANGTLWMDTSNPDVPVLKEWSESSAMWVEIPTTYLRISGANVGKPFAQYDGVTVSGLTGDAETFNGSHVIYARDDDWIVVTGIMTTGALTQSGGLKVERKAPDMDYVTECDNRIWGCKYGLVNGKPVNEIYASKLGDFKNWSCYMGLATDSYAAGRGSDGVFTGACTYQGHPLFFREECIEKVFPSATGAHQIVTVECRGLQEGCWRSLAIENETLFYKNRHGVCAYTGAMPYSVSDALGHDYFADARAGAAGGMYYISMRNTLDDTWHFFTYDIAKGIWNREDDTVAMMFTQNLGRIYYVDETDGGKVKRYYSQSESAEDRAIDWSVTSNVIGLNLAENQYVSRFVIRCETRGQVHLEVRYDEDGLWTDKGTYEGSGLGSFVLPVTPKRCDHLRYRLSGNRPVKIYSVTKYVEQGSDQMW